MVVVVGSLVSLDRPISESLVALVREVGQAGVDPHDGGTLESAGGQGVPPHRSSRLWHAGFKKVSRSTR